MIEMYFEDALDDDKYMGHLYGLGTNHAKVRQINTFLFRYAAAYRTPFSNLILKMIFQVR